MTSLTKSTILTSQKAILVEPLKIATKNQLFQFEGRLYVRTSGWRSDGFATRPSSGQRIHVQAIR